MSAISSPIQSVVQRFLVYKPLIILFAVLSVALSLVPWSLWWGTLILVWIFLQISPRLLPGWLQWCCVLLLSAHLAVLAGWSFGLALALCSTITASVYWQETQVIRSRILAQLALLLFWFAAMWWFQPMISLELNILIGLLFLIWSLFGGEAT